MLNAIQYNINSDNPYIVKILKIYNYDNDN